MKENFDRNTADARDVSSYLLREKVMTVELSWVYAAKLDSTAHKSNVS